MTQREIPEGQVLPPSILPGLGMMKHGRYWTNPKSQGGNAPVGFAVGPGAFEALQGLGLENSWERMDLCSWERMDLGSWERMDLGSWERMDSGSAVAPCSPCRVC